MTTTTTTRDATTAGTGLWTIDEAAAYLGMSRKTLANRVYRGDVPSVRPLGGKRRLDPLVCYAVRAGLTGDQLRAVARLAEGHTHDREERVRRYVADVKGAQP